MRPAEMCTRCHHHLSEHQAHKGELVPCTHGDDKHQQMDPEAGPRCGCAGYVESEESAAYRAKSQKKAPKAPTPTGLAAELHRHHVGYDRTGGGWRLDCPGGVTVRMEGGSKELRQAVAYRLAFTWNMAEGLRIEHLEAGRVAEQGWAAVELAAVVELLLREPGDQKVWDLLRQRLAGFQKADAALVVDKVECDCGERHQRYAELSDEKPRRAKKQRQPSEEPQAQLFQEAAP